MKWAQTVCAAVAFALATGLTIFIMQIVADTLNEHDQRITELEHWRALERIRREGERWSP